MPDLKVLIGTNMRLYGGVVGVKDLILTKVTPGNRTAGAAASGTNPTPGPYPASGRIETYETKNVPGTLVAAANRTITIYGDQLPDGVVPGANDKITMEDLDGVTRTFFIVGDVKNDDGVGAIFTCQARA